MKATVTFEDKKKKAIELMEELGIYKPYIRGFKQDNTICYFEQYAGFWAYQDEELMKKIKEFEERTGNLVYAVTHEYLEFGECYDFLIIPKYKADWKYLISPSLWKRLCGIRIRLEQGRRLLLGIRHNWHSFVWRRHKKICLGFPLSSLIIFASVMAAN